MCKCWYRARFVFFVIQINDWWREISTDGFLILNLLLFSAVFFDFKEKEREERDQDRICLFQLMYHNLIYCTQSIQIKEISIRLQ